jgi:crotonobetainyl-CoA:carnitine CoA-transferase CaiB-like acyl-CoA transferase
MIGQAMSGVMIDQGGGPTKGKPVQVLSSNMCDQIGGIMAAAAIMGALVHKARTGEGQRVDTSQLGAIMSLNAFSMMKSLKFNRQTDTGSPPGTGRWDQQFFECQHGKWISIAWPEQKMWEVCVSRLHLMQLLILILDAALQAGLKVLERTDLCAPNVGSSSEERSKGENRKHLYEEVGKTVKDWERGALVDALVAVKVPVAPVYDYADAIEEPQMWENGYLSRLPDGKPHIALRCSPQISALIPDLCYELYPPPPPPQYLCAWISRYTMRMLPLSCTDSCPLLCIGSRTHGIAASMSRTPPSIQGMPPEAGEHTREVMQQLGFDEAEMRELFDAGAIQEHDGSSPRGRCRL